MYQQGTKNTNKDYFSHMIGLFNSLIVVIDMWLEDTLKEDMRVKGLVPDNVHDRDVWELALRSDPLVGARNPSGVTGNTA